MGLFRPCIDIHNGYVKQIVGGSLKDEGDIATDNFVSDKDAAYYAEMFRGDGLVGGHIIILNAPDSALYEKTRQQALGALLAYPGGLQAGGSVNPENAAFYVEAGASAVIVTSYVFLDGRLSMERLGKLNKAVGANRLVLDLSCRKRDGRYMIVTDRWQTFTELELAVDTLERLSDHVGEFLVHAVDAEGKKAGIDEGVLRILSEYEGKPVTYAGGIRSMDDIDTIITRGRGKVSFTVGSALDIYGGKLRYEELKRM